jgi:hypothetical protein
MKAASFFSILLLVGCDTGTVSVQSAQQASRVDHTCTLSTLPTTCGVPADQLPCCAVQTDRGEEQIDCCPNSAFYLHRLCAAGVPTCTLGGQYPNTCQGLVCPPLSWPCTDQAGCCNDGGQIGPRGCSIMEKLSYDGSCDTFGPPGNTMCIGTYEYQGQSYEEVVKTKKH